MSESSRPKAVIFNVRQQTERWLSPLNLHWTGVGLLATVNLYLLISMGILWREAKSQDADALSAQRVTLQTAVLAAKPLEGLDAKLAKANSQAEEFYEERLPVSYSEIATELGVLKDKNHVRLSGMTYTQAPVAGLAALKGHDEQLTELRMDANLGGDYRGLVEFLNGLERDKVFFVVNGVTLTGQESGRVNLRMKLTTYLRGLSTDEEAARASTPVSTADELDSQAAALQGGHR
jgi:hypothetical protein